MKKRETKAHGREIALIFSIVVFFASCLFVFSADAAKNKVNLKKIVVTNVDSSTITVSKKGRTYALNIISARLFSANKKKIYSDQIFVGDKINVNGNIVNGQIFAKTIKDNTLKKNILAQRTHSADTVFNANVNSPLANPINVSTSVSSYPLHTNITATVFWVGEPVGGGSSEDNALSAWDDAWQAHFGCFDDPFQRNGYFPSGCTPKENPFYFDLPYDDFNWDTGDGRRSDAYQVVPWANSKKWGENESMLKNRWIKIVKDSNVCYAQWEDAGPYVYDDANYVFSTKDARPKSKEANNAGMDASPALRDCLKFDGLNNDTNKVSWQFVEAAEVPAGPWKNIITTSGTFWK